MKLLIALVLICTLPLMVSSGPLAYGICQTGCNALAVACYAAAGATMGVTFGASAPASVIACNAALGVCMSGCVAAGFAPTP